MNSIKRIALAGLALSALALSAPAIAQEGESRKYGSFEGSVAFTSDYVFRGFSQSNEDFAVQGSLDWSHDSGAYFGAWASSIEFLDEDLNGAKTTSSSVELDFYGGMAGDFANSLFSWNVGFVFFAYPNDPEGTSADYWEVGGTLGADLGFVSVSLGAWWSPDFYGGIGDAYYFPLGIEVPIPLGNGPLGLTLSANIGLQMFDEPDTVALGDDDYIHWDLGLSVAVSDWFDVDLRYHDTDIGDALCKDICDERFVVSLSRSF